jgi:hypothetical protein
VSGFASGAAQHLVRAVALRSVSAQQMEMGLVLVELQAYRRRLRLRLRHLEMVKVMGQNQLCM